MFLLYLVAITMERVVANMSSAEFIREGRAIIPSKTGYLTTKNVQVGLQIHSLSNLDFRKSTFKASISLTLVWENSGRSVGQQTYRFDQYEPPFSDILLSGQRTENLDNYRMVITTPDRTATTRSRYEVEVYCPFRFDRLPFDSHQCEISVFAARHSVRELTLSWLPSDRIVSDVSIDIPNARVTSVIKDDCEFDSMLTVSKTDIASE
ncbi:hypothetical protein AB6A40_010536 [Gnathostoma spinigerum]|uniref:Neurotransmitter-gated ion-channel ligand-binding domain-containing protein n=1 Tax=Gnathostoma spinigerum TaxID=75299 RepID=A0ABD6F2X3_9BILA